MPESYEINTLDKETYETVRMVIEIRRRVSDGSIFTLHRPMTPGDQKRMNKWEGKGLSQVSKAFMIEYMRREAINVLGESEAPSWDTEGLIKEVEKRARDSIRSAVRGSVESAIGAMSRFR